MRSLRDVFASFGMGSDTMHIRLLDSRAVRNLPAWKRCMEKLVQRGSLRRIGGTPIWELTR
jgi:hypothetical protein